MLDLIYHQLARIMNAVPALFVDPESVRFTLIRGMFALIVVLLVISLIALQPFRAMLKEWAERLRQLFTSRS